jgi:hypothetical protein
MAFELNIGTRAQVWHGTAKKTSGGLTKSQLIKNKAGRIVSKAKHFTAKKDRRLVKAGYGTKKGKFGFVKIGKSTKSKRGGNTHHAHHGSHSHHMKHRGGSGISQSLSPSSYNGKGVGTSGVDLQFVAGNAN